ncbi:RNA chaperone Hfq [Gluconobacter wancherniae]|uniref:RNA chaperone Hfq n=1 Tax=Gluconobacter wancherniae TaxID=1307955 RepID=UPI001B8D1006|nr:RNA chaperone Hfq [Gluconobacter wancherniae]MBS1087498.1 RNA chaperone Hfq [Gluconobacter wancherniae]MBS1093181.1 RNA chaperone Hfq [Gluconobacter wancherniae]
MTSDLPSSADPTGVQEVFLNHLRQSEAPVTVFLVNGVKLQGVVAQFDGQTLLLRRDGHVQLVYKHAVSTIMPVATMPRFMESDIERI